MRVCVCVCVWGRVILLTDKAYDIEGGVCQDGCVGFVEVVV